MGAEKPAAKLWCVGDRVWRVTAAPPKGVTIEVCDVRTGRDLKADELEVLYGADVCLLEAHHDPRAVVLSVGSGMYGMQLFELREHSNGIEMTELVPASYCGAEFSADGRFYATHPCEGGESQAAIVDRISLRTTRTLTWTIPGGDDMETGCQLIHVEEDIWLWTSSAGRLYLYNQRNGQLVDEVRIKGFGQVGAHAETWARRFDDSLYIVGGSQIARVPARQLLKQSQVCFPW